MTRVITVASESKYHVCIVMVFVASRYVKVIYIQKSRFELELSWSYGNNVVGS